ncbi:hypothetical protein THAOC_04743, partial [Thalassiosira oceanica]
MKIEVPDRLTKWPVGKPSAWGTRNWPQNGPGGPVKRAIVEILLGPPSIAFARRREDEERGCDTATSSRDSQSQSHHRLDEANTRKKSLAREATTVGLAGTTDSKCDHNSDINDTNDNSDTVPRPGEGGAAPTSSTVLP